MKKFEVVYTVQYTREFIVESEEQIAEELSSPMVTIISTTEVPLGDDDLTQVI